MRNPWAAAASERKRIGVRDVVSLNNQLTGTQVPPEIGVSGAARGHSQQAEEEDSSKERAPARKKGHEKRVGQL